MAEKTSRLAYAKSLVATARVCVPTIAEGLSGTMSRSRVDRRLREWARETVRATEAKVVVRGRGRFDPKETFVVMSNHQSNFDIIALYYAYPSSLRMVAKMEMRRIPLLGRAMDAAEFIFVNRKNNAQAREALGSAEERIQSGISVWIAPEGTRSKTGELGPFKKGGFMLALSTGVRILPCTIMGTRNVAPVGQGTVQLHEPVSVEFHKPIDPADYGLERRDELIEAVRERIASGLS